MYHSQPWLAEEAVRDVRIEDERLASAMEEARLAADLRTLRQNIKTGKDTVKDLEDKMKKLQAEIPHFLTPLPDEDGEPVTEKNEAPEDKQVPPHARLHLSPTSLRHHRPIILHPAVLVRNVLRS